MRGDSVVVWGYGDKSFVEGSVVESREADAVAGVEPVLLVGFVGPWYDMAGQQQFSNIDARLRTTTTIVGKDHVPEIILSLSTLGFRGDVFSFFSNVEVVYQLRGNSLWIGLQRHNHVRFLDVLFVLGVVL